MRFLAAFTLILVVSSFYSAFSFERGHWFREGYWVIFELSLIALGVAYRNLLVAVPFIAHMYWVGMSGLFGADYTLWKDGFWVVDVPITFAYAINAYRYSSPQWFWRNIRTQKNRVEVST